MASSPSLTYVRCVRVQVYGGGGALTTAADASPRKRAKVDAEVALKLREAEKAAKAVRDKAIVDAEASAASYESQLQKAEQQQQQQQQQFEQQQRQLEERKQQLREKAEHKRAVAGALRGQT